MNREYYVNLAKRMIIDNIYRSAKLEGIDCTFASTEAILNNVNTNLKPNDIRVIFALRDAWYLILNNIDKETDLALLKEIHECIGRSCDISYNEIGKFRTSEVYIGGTNWRPELPNEDKVFKLLKKDKPVTLTDGIDIYLKLCRMQCFQDGNKRCANLLANHFLIHNCIGILSINVNLIEEYKTKLIQYYETGMSFDIQMFLQQKCIFNENKLK